MNPELATTRVPQTANEARRLCVSVDVVAGALMQQRRVGGQGNDKSTYVGKLGKAWGKCREGKIGL